MGKFFDAAVRYVVPIQYGPDPMSSNPMDTPPPFDATPRPLGYDDVEKFIRAAESTDGPAASGSALTINAFLHRICHTDPFRMRRIAKDLDWLRKQARKRGLTDEDVRCML